MYCTLKWFYFVFKSILYTIKTLQRRIENVENDYFGLAPLLKIYYCLLTMNQTSSANNLIYC